ncbi:acyltransferase family protein [Pseudomonas nitroreducens]|uniref:acyltransferase family protein n=1 Tax=Pseudomonas nitroreducens TaxID=46680 RepID=UPI003CC836C0
MQTSHKIEEIQALRAIAVILVVFFHTRFDLTGAQHPSLATLFSYLGGDAGVDLFFVISGFVIARGLIPNLQATTNTAQRKRELLVFWLKRAFRLLPSAWFWLAFTLVCALLFNDSGAFGHFRAAYEGAMAAVLNVANVRFMECFGQFECGPTFVYWSLSLEEQFYLALPILVLLSRKFLVPVLLLLLLSQLPESTSVSPVFRFGGLILGVLLAIFSRSSSYRWAEPNSLQGRRWIALPLFILLLLILSTVLGSEMKVVSGTLKYDLVALPAALLVLLASYDRGYLLPPGLLRTLLVWIGERSYALYLIHIPAYYLSREILFGSSLAGETPTQQWINHGLLSVALMLLFSEFSYRVIEMPWQRRGHQLLAKLGTPAAVPSSKPLDDGQIGDRA